MAANTSWMKARQTKFAAYTAVYVLIVLAVLMPIIQLNQFAK